MKDALPLGFIGIGLMGKPMCLRLLAAGYGALDRIDEARKAMSEVLRLIPDQTQGELRNSLPYRDPEVVRFFVECLARGGLPK